MKKNWAQDFLAGRISRRDFVDYAAWPGECRGHRPGSARRTDTASQRYAEIPRLQSDQPQSIRGMAQERSIQVYSGYSLPDIRNAPVQPWKRMGVSGAYIDLIGGEGVNDGYLCEIPSGARRIRSATCLRRSSTSSVARANRHLGAGRPQADREVESGRGDRAAAQHLAPAPEPRRRACRLLAISNAPVVIDLFHNVDFVFNNDYVFRDRYNGDPDAFGPVPNTSTTKTPIRRE